MDELKEINLGTTENPRPIILSINLSQEEEDAYKQLMIKYKDVFVWSYKEMFVLDLKVAIHHLAIKKEENPVKQPQRCF